MGNIQGLYPKSNQSKVPYLGDLAKIEDFMIIALTETHLSVDVRDAEIQLENYTIYRTDRKNRSHGGTIIYLRDDITPNAKLILSYTDDQVQLQALHIQKLNMVVINCYRPPACSLTNFENSISELEHLYKTLPTPTPDLVLCEDFNFPFIKWPDGIIAGAPQSDKVRAEKVLHLTNSMFLMQVINTPTRGNNILDLFFINNRDAISSYMTNNTISDHSLITITTNYTLPDSPIDKSIPPMSNPFSKFNFFNSNINWNEVNSCLSNLNWDTLLQGNDPNVLLNSFLEIILTVCEDKIPKRRSLTSRKSNIPKDRKILMKRTSLTQQLMKTTNDNHKRALHRKIATTEREIKTSHEEQRNKEEIQAISNIKSNPKYFFSYCKKISKAKTKIGPLQLDNGKMSCPQETCSVLAQQYTTVFSQPKAESIVNNPQEFFSVQNNDNPQLNDIHFTKTDVLKAISEIRVNSAAGPDGVPAIFLTKCKEALTSPLQKIWRLSLDTGIIPKRLKEDIISPIHKGGERSVTRNYRPVALTSHIIKIFEKILRNNIIKYLEKHQLLSKSQHGFRKGRSCLSNLLSHYEWLLQGLTRRGNVDVVCLDFAKAFDRVDHGILSHKLKAVGIKGKIGTWLHNFVRTRTQVVAVDGHRKVSSSQWYTAGLCAGPATFLGPNE
ncbi:uncharacterized protein LOC143027968 [Oratosquilla oratoria]|uniref:uncharacterized protein LOC143027968 n=1 Tax=Oratosquilla oratoria TaxID=337810 RepID=UPI003F765E99